MGRSGLIFAVARSQHVQVTLLPHVIAWGRVSFPKRLSLGKKGSLSVEEVRWKDPGPSMSVMQKRSKVVSDETSVVPISQGNVILLCKNTSEKETNFLSCSLQQYPQFQQDF